GKNAVLVVIEARALIEQVRHLRLAARGAEIAPAVDRVHFGRVARRVALDDADRAGIGPGWDLERRERGGEPAMMRMDALAAGAHADAAPDLVAEAGALTLGIEAQRLETEPMLVGQRAQGLQCGAPRAEDAVDEGQRVGVDLGRG